MDLLGQLFAPYMPLVYGVCLKYLKQPEDAKDAVVHIFEELSVKLRKHEVENFRSWLHTVSKNHCLMILRKGKNIPQELSDAVMYSVEKMHQDDDSSIREQQYNAMEECLETLNDEQQLVVKLFYLCEKSYKEISDLHGLPLDTVRSRIQNGRRNLKICMENKIGKE